MARKITEKIYEDLEQRLRQQTELPFRLTLSDIAGFYNVSLTPIREVVQNLLDNRVLVKLENGRLRVSDSLSSIPPSAIQLVSAKPDIEVSNLEQTVTDDVMTLSLQQFDRYLREEASAHKYNVGRTVIRQIFSRLAGQGLLEHIPRCGWRVVPFQSKDMLDYLEVREMLEVKALRLAWDHLDHQFLQELLKKNQQVSDDSESDVQTVQLDDELHLHWIKNCGNRYIEDFFERHAAFYSALFDFAALGDRVRHAMAKEHCTILNAILDNNQKLAEQRLIEHIRDQKANVEQLIRKLSAAV